MIISVLSGFLAVLVIPVLQRIFRQRTGYFLALLPLSLTCYFGWQFANGVATTPIRDSLVWNSSFDLELAFHLDGLSLLFSLLITGIGTLIFFYAGSYMKGYRHQARFYCFLSMFMASMLGLVLADNLLTLVVFWEMTGIASFLLIGFEYSKDRARAAAFQGLLVTGFGGLVLLAGVLLMGQVSGTYTISEIIKNPEAVRNSSLYLPILLCVLFGSFTKSAQVPFHFWLPNAMAAPTPVSAYLHSATMVKAGIYFVARFFPVLGETFEWQLILSVIGSLTMLTGAVLAFRSTDLKQLLAYSTISALGIMMLAFGIGSEAAIKAGLAYILAHALYKSTLFMIAGVVDHETGTRNLLELPPLLYKNMKVTTVWALLAGLSFAGIIPFFGFVAKEMLLEMTLHAPSYSYLLTAVVVLTSALFVANVLIIIHQGFVKGSGDEDAEPPHEVPFWFLLPPALTAIAGLFVGVFTGFPSRLISGAAVALSPDISPVSLKLWHGWNAALWLSVASVAAGVAIYGLYSQFRKPGALDRAISALKPSLLYERGTALMLKFAKWQISALQTGYLRYYVMITVLSILIGAGITFFYKAGIRLNADAIQMYVFEVVLGVIATIALVFILAIRSEIGAILSLGIVAIVVSIIFLEYGAPDLAITWFLVDTLTVTLFVLIIHKLPKTVMPKSSWATWRDAGIAVGVGALMTCILLSLTYDPLDSKLKEFYAAKSYSEAHGRNLVNVILVDFRALDTFGEIIVLAIAALGVYALLGYSGKPIKSNK